MLLLVISSSFFATQPTPSELTMTGYNEEFTQTINNLDSFIPALKNSKPLEKDTGDTAYLEKPEVIKTISREEIDKHEREKNLKLTTRNVISRERIANTQKQDNQSPKSSHLNSYWYGFCTWYAAQKRPDVPGGWGNAKSWLSSAQKDGWSVGNEPRIGAIVVTKESWAGHVGYVEKIAGDSVIISEMNFRGWARVSTRTIDKNNPLIRGYIY